MDEFKMGSIRVEVRKADTPEHQLLAVDKAIKVFKRKVEKDGVLFTLKDRKYYTKPSQLEHAKVQRIKRHKELERRRNKK